MGAQVPCLDLYYVGQVLEKTGKSNYVCKIAPAGAQESEDFKMYPKGYDPDSFVSNPGERFKPEYIGEPDEYGIINLVEVGKTDLVELHNRDADLNNVNVLYQRFCNGDISALSQVQGSFLDAIGLPRDLRGMYETINDMHTAYDNLSEDLRSRYTFEQFLENAGSEQWMKDFVKVPSSEEPKDISNPS